MNAATDQSVGIPKRIGGAAEVPLDPNRGIKVHDAPGRFRCQKTASISVMAGRRVFGWDQSLVMSDVQGVQTDLLRGKRGRAISCKGGFYSSSSGAAVRQVMDDEEEKQPVLYQSRTPQRRRWS